MEIIGPYVCEYCGSKGFHPQCELAMAESHRRFQEMDADYLQRYSLHGSYGIVGEESVQTYEQARTALENHLLRPLECGVDRTIEGKNWWFFPEGWIGVIGFIVEKDSNCVIALGSGLVGLSGLANTPGHWCGIVEYVAGRVRLDADGHEVYCRDDALS